MDKKLEITRDLEAIAVIRGILKPFPASDKLSIIEYLMGEVIGDMKFIRMLDGESGEEDEH
jgi:hypothetical protein